MCSRARAPALNHHIPLHLHSPFSSTRRTQNAYIQMEYCGANAQRSSFVQTSNVCKMHKVRFMHTKTAMIQNHGVLLSFTLDSLKLPHILHQSFVLLLFCFRRDPRTLLHSFVRPLHSACGRRTFAFSLLLRVAVYRCFVGQAL